MENERVERLQREAQPPSDPKRELLNSIGLFIGPGLLGFWFGVGGPAGPAPRSSFKQ